MANTKKRKKISSKETTAGFINDLRWGQTVGLDFFRRNAWLIIVFLVAILSLMGLRFKTMSKMSEIKKLTSELHTSESNKLQNKAQYMSLIREQEMQRLVNQQGLSLQFQESPPYELQVSDTKQNTDDNTTSTDKSDSDTNLQH